MMKQLVSIIIPCYNSADTAEATFKSVEAQSYQNWEAIIVNDGSPDNIEALALGWVKKDIRFKYFKQENKGLGAARNFGIQKANGEFILPLDSDNMLQPDYILKTLAKMNDSNLIGVVYSNANYFGEKEGIWNVGEYELQKLLSHNYIDACTLIRKRVFDDLGIYDDQMPHQGHEDWEFWLRVSSSEYEFSYLDEALFDYRVTSGSMIRSFDHEMDHENKLYVLDKYKLLYLENYSKVYYNYSVYKRLHDNSIKQKIKRTFKS